MSSTAPAVAMMQLVGATTLTLYSIFHAWKFDKLLSLRPWRMKNRSDRFQTSLIVGYLLGLPAFAIQALIMVAIKYRYGFFPITSHGGIPKPIVVWSTRDQHLARATNFIYAFACAMELSVHQSELNYWVFLTRLRPASKSWFKSVYYYFTLAGFGLSVVMFLVLAVLTFRDVDHFMAFNFTITGLGILIQNALFAFWIIPLFPRFLTQVKGAGGSSALLRRLFQFNETNKIRVVTRTVFGACLVVVACDGLTKRKAINMTPWAVDFVLLLALPSWAAQATATLYIFLPLRNPFDGEMTFASLKTESTRVGGDNPYKVSLGLNRVSDMELRPFPSATPSKPLAAATRGPSPSTDEGSAPDLRPSHPFGLRRKTSTPGFVATALLHPELANFTSPINIRGWLEKCDEDMLEVPQVAIQDDHAPDRRTSFIGFDN